MKEHLRKYFPDRFEDSSITQLNIGSFKLMYNHRHANQLYKCNLLVKEVLEKSNELQILAGAMKRYGCNFNLNRHISCERCHDCHGGYDPDTHQIVICSNAHLTKNRIMATMMHEMIHMFDYCRAKFDFDNLDHVACSEIRAANLTYCSLSDKLSFGGQPLFDIKQTHQYCVKDVASRSVKAYSPETPDDRIKEIVEKVFPGCYNDLEPFGRRPTTGDLKQSYRERHYFGYV